MSGETPRTDENAFACYEDGKPNFVSVGFARQLETELAQAKEDLDSKEQFLAEVVGQLDNVIEKLKDLRKDLDNTNNICSDVMRERDAAKAELREYEQCVLKALDASWWPSTLGDANERYFIPQDDAPSNSGSGLAVAIGWDGDAWVKTYQPVSESCRFRTFSGGGRSMRVRQALIILAMAIKLDSNEVQNG